MSITTYHVPVLLSEVIAGLQLKPGMTVIDGTLGGGGHARAILQQIQPGGTLIGFDQDQMAVQHVQQTLGKDYSTSQLVVRHDNFSNVLLHLQMADAVLLDLGVSMRQLKQPGRGFSFRLPDDPLDMRMDERSGVTAAHLLNTLAEKELAQLIRNYGEDPKARRIAHLIVVQRQERPFTQVVDLLECLDHVYPLGRYSVQQAAARTFQALRIAVNQELSRLPQALTDLIALLTPGGRMAVITFHSLEDRIVKQVFREAALSCVCPPDFPECRCQRQPTVHLITKHVIIPSAAEIDRNPAAHSAKLRLIEKI